MGDLRSSIRSQDFRVLRPIRFFPRDFFDPLPSNTRGSDYTVQGTVNLSSFRVPSDLLRNSIRRVLISKNFRILRRPLENELVSTSTEEVILPSIKKISYKDEERKTTRNYSVNSSLNNANNTGQQVNLERLRVPLEPILDKEENNRTEGKITIKTGFFGNPAQGAYYGQNDYNHKKDAFEKSGKERLLRRKVRKNSIKSSVKSSNKVCKRRLSRQNKENVRPNVTEESIPMLTFGKKINYSRVYCL
eukprot:TRINITY_DN7818_c0_g2_i1.p1 TRINITY_DN7818_c0_g2~~TRINITY_DN7818_c0_g2_i1.p1  ORF type:complete len:247 (+),score=53.52 TRINITY_DN7818_c0_g2_i1:82-822(+)